MLCFSPLHTVCHNSALILSMSLRTSPHKGCSMNVPELLVQGRIGKGKGHPITSHQGPREGVEVYLYSFTTSALEGGRWSAPRHGRFTSGKDPVPIVQEARWAPAPVWACAKNLATVRRQVVPDRNAVRFSKWWPPQQHSAVWTDCVRI
jgi:hypothetical protein